MSRRNNAILAWLTTDGVALRFSSSSVMGPWRGGITIACDVQLPTYSSTKVMKEKLLYVANSGAGFEMT